METKRCIACGTEKPIDDFHNQKARKDGRYPYCKACAQIKNREYHNAHYDQIHAKQRERWWANREELMAQTRAWQIANKEVLAERSRVRRLEMKLAALAHYGPACTCCGELDSRLLSMEHSNGDGANHRRSLGGPKKSGSFFYRWLRDHDYPDDLGLTVLCHSCNWGSGHNKNGCPHQDPDPQFLTSTAPELIQARVAWLEQRLALEADRLVNPSPRQLHKEQRPQRLSPPLA